ncbi:unnamed protein product [Brachionus calyciflorus]|uniref:Centriolar satellite-associated tubulin polyglutamylase complex regulator 1 n=1 Tax=Brachionus calyciflorus TaxID=104777 RepID=A0A813R1L8_9BILA|nr:unnamed protein product [Brachionus calyciflorus]
MSYDQDDLVGQTQSADNYISRNFIMEYLNDSVEQLLEIKNIDPKIDVLEYFTEYFKTVLEGNHILYRDYTFVSSTPYNRACFVQKFFELFSQFLFREETVNCIEMHSLVMLICVNFPKHIIEKSFNIASNEENSKILFKNFVYLFQLQFYYDEFLNDSKEVFENLQNKSKSNDSKNFDKNLKSFTDSLNRLIDQSKYSCPSKNIINQVKAELDDDWDYYKFLNKLALNKSLTKNIGKLPCYQDLNEYQDNFLKNEKLSKEPKIEKLSVETKANNGNFKSANLLRQKSFLNIANSFNKTSSTRDVSSSTDSSSDTDT